MKEFVVQYPELVIGAFTLIGSFIALLLSILIKNLIKKVDDLSKDLKTSVEKLEGKIENNTQCEYGKYERLLERVHQLEIKMLELRTK